jgi:hypothetical protein
MNNSRDAFLFSVQKLNQETGKLYLWTFTFRKAQNDDEALKAWNSFSSNGRRDFYGVHGLRVTELHKEHGIHFHLLLNKRFPVRRMLALAWPFGFGKVHVCLANMGSARYLAKYLTKQYKAQTYFKRRRRWGTFGGFKATLCKDVTYDTSYTRNKVLLPEKPLTVHRLILGAFSGFGDFANWPPSVLRGYQQCISTGQLPTNNN